MRQFTQVESLASRQSRQQQALASHIGYHTAPHEMERAAPSYNPPPSMQSSGEGRVEGGKREGMGREEGGMEEWRE